MGKIVAVSVAAIAVLVSVLALTKAGHVIDAATQHFMLYYAGVLALVGLTGSVLLGLLATDRIVMTPGHRVMAQAVHRAFSFGTLVFLIIHIVTEILAQRSHVIDAAVPFLSPYRTFYIGLGAIASDLILLLVITSVLRKRFTADGNAWRWRAIHYSSYAAFVFGVLHGLLGGRAAKPYVDWSYGFAIAVTALGLAVRFLAISLRPKESVNSSPSVDRAGAASSGPMRAATLAMAQAQLGGATQLRPGGLAAGGFGAGIASGATSWTATALPATGRSPASGPFAALGPAPAHAAEPAYAGSPLAPDPYGAVPDAYGMAPDVYSDLGFMPLGAPPWGEDAQNGMRARPYVNVQQPRPALASPARQPRYEPGYDGPPRFEGAPRGHGDVPQDELSSYPYGPRGRQPQPLSPYPADYPDRSALDGRTAARPGPMGPATPLTAIPPPPPRPGDRISGPQPQLGSGPRPRPDTGPMPRVDTGPRPRPDTGPMPRLDTGPIPRVDTSARPRPDTGPMPRVGGGQPPRHGTGPMPRSGTGPMPRAESGPPTRPGSGPMPRLDTGPMPRVNTGPMPRVDTGPMPRAGGGQSPRHSAHPAPQAGRGQVSRADTGSMPRLGTGPMPRPDTGPMPRPDTGSLPRLESTGPVPRSATGRTGSGPRHGRPTADRATGLRTDSPPRPATRPSHRAKSTDPRYRDVPGPTGGSEWE